MRLALVLLIVASLSPVALAEITATPTRLRETRTKDLAPADTKRPAFFMDNNLALTLKLSGPELKDATEYKTPEVTAATDDTGASLVDDKTPRFGGRDGFRDIQRMEFEFDENGKKKEPSSDLTVEVPLKLPNRSAKKLTVVKGAVAVRAGGEKKQVSVKNLKAMAGKTVEDPALAAVNVKVKILAPKANPGGFGGAGSLALEITGDRDPIKSIEVVDAAGKKMSQGHSAFGTNNVTQYDINLRKPLDDTMILQFNLVTGQKVISVPFELKDVELP